MVTHIALGSLLCCAGAYHDARLPRSCL